MFAVLIERPNGPVRPLRRSPMPRSATSKLAAAKSVSPKRPSSKAASATVAADDAEAPESEAVNLAVVRGTVSSPPDVRVLPSETSLVQLQVTTRLAAETLSMPVSVWNPAAWIEALEPGDEIVVVGRVRRRFFRAGGATASRVELEADFVARARDRRRVRAAVRRASAALAPLDD
jgi:single-strand DNA-binding protein